MLISEINKTANVSAHQLKPSGPSGPSATDTGQNKDKYGITIWKDHKKEAKTSTLYAL